MTMRRAAWAFALSLPAAGFAVTALHAQAIMRTPNLNLAPRATAVNPVVAPHVDPGRTVTAVRPQLPHLHTSPHLNSGCEAARRGDDGECRDAMATANGVGGAPRKGRSAAVRRDRAPVQAAVGQPATARELLAEIDGALSEAQADEIARRHGLRRIASQNFPLIGATIGLFRIADRRSFDTVSREFATEASVRSVQPNYRYVLQQAAPREGDPAQYALAKLRLPEAHMLAHGTGVKVAVIDSGIDVRHPELAGSIADNFDALGSGEGPHVHGTGIAGAIVAHGRLMGAAPLARIVAIRAFSAAANGAQSNSYVILKALDFAVRQDARIVNMSFAGPKDAMIERGIAAVAARGVVMIAAAGNGGERSPPLYPAANPNVIAVSATDAQDRLFDASNRGGYVALAAPGVDIFLPAPDGKYQMISGTSFSAAYVSGLAALMLERNPALKREELRATLTRTARDLGSPGRDDQFGAGEADAFAAVEAVIAVSSAAPAPREQMTREIKPDAPGNALARPLTPSASTMAAEKPAGQ